MFKIGGVAYTAGEVRALIRASADTVWHPQYPFYIYKISKSGATTFANLPDLIMRLAGYIMGESECKGDPKELAKARGKLPANAAICYDPIAVAGIRGEDQAAVTALIGNVADPTLTDNGAHATDPETGAAKLGTVSVKEYYINGGAGRRAVRRVENGKATVYYSSSHAYNTYQYRLVF